jgi:hypothetical protein
MSTWGAKRCWSSLLVLSGILLLLPVTASAELKVGINGYVKLDALYNSKNFGINNGPTNVPLDVDRRKADDTTNAGRDRRDNGETRFDARESRFTINVTDKIGMVSMKGLIEVDFYGSEADALTFGSHGPRLFHGFAQADVDMGGKRTVYLLIGQTWSYFQNSDIAVPTTVDFNGPAGQIYSRQPQLRLAYSVPVAPKNDIVFGISIEQQSFQAFNLTNSFTSARGEGQDFPLVALKAQWLQEEGYKGEVAFAVSRAKYAVEGLTAGNTETESQTVWGFQYSGSYTIGPLEPFIHFQYVSGLNRLANGDFSDVAGRTVGTTIETEPIKSIGGYVGAAYKLTPNTSFNMLYGRNQAKRIRDFGFNDANLRKHQSVHANVIHNFWERWRVGVEYERMWVRAFNNQEGHVDIGHGGFWFFF